MNPIRVLLVEDDPDYVELIGHMLAQPQGRFQIETAKTFKDSLAKLPVYKPQIILLDLNLSDSRGFATFREFRHHAPTLPVVICTCVDDEEGAVEAVRHGAQDYIVKGRIDSQMLPRIVRYAMERHRLESALLNLSFLDDLTGLYNRRGFLALAERHFALARRSNREHVLFFADLDRFKQINDQHGHLEGDRALQKAAHVLKTTFRQTDLLARLGGDEFAVIAIEAQPGTAGTMTRRLENNLRKHNEQATKPYKISFSMGAAYFDPKKPASVEDLMREADRALYAGKSQKAVR